MKIFLVCDADGGVMDVIPAKTFKKAYEDTIGLNNGSLLVELNKQIIAEIKALQASLAKNSTTRRKAARNHIHAPVTPLS